MYGIAGVLSIDALKVGAFVIIILALSGECATGTTSAGGGIQPAHSRNIITTAAMNLAGPAGWPGLRRKIIGAELADDAVSRAKIWRVRKRPRRLPEYAEPESVLYTQGIPAEACTGLFERVIWLNKESRVKVLQSGTYWSFIILENGKPVQNSAGDIIMCRYRSDIFLRIYEPVQ